jgi:pimeloyl-ACP methyl ester carboxylesterase
VGRNWQDFLPLIPELSQAWHVFAVDLRGHGASGRVPGGYTSFDYGSDIQALLARVIGRPAVLFGHSLGGIVGMRLAADEQNRISALIVGDSVLSREALQHSLYTALFTGLHRVALHGGGIEQMATELARIQIPVPHLDHPVALGDFPGNDDAYFRRWADCLRQVDAQVFEMTLDGSSLADFEAPALLSKIQCPTLILQASPDLGGLMSDKDVENAARLLRRCTVERFPLLGHALHLQRPKPVLDAILRFLQPLQKHSLRTLRT